MKINGITIGMLAAIAGWGLGCAGYHAGPTGGRIAGARSVQVQFFENETFESQYLVTAVNRALKREFQKDGTYSLETQSKGDLIVTGKLIDFRRNGVSYKPGDVLTVQDYTMELTAEITVFNRADEEIFRETLTGTSTVRVGNDLTAGQRQAIPTIAGKLAEQAVLHIVDGNWPDPQPAIETP